MQRTSVETLLMKLIALPSQSGEEETVATFLEQYLRDAGFSVTTQTVQDKRQNVFAQIGVAKIVLQAHMDVVPPHLAVSEDELYLYGRGACDTKGSIATMICAAQQAKESGCDDFGLLFTVGEEVDFCGAREAQKLFTKTQPYFVVGEPTQLQPVTEHFGVLVLEVEVRGKAAHSSEPQLGDNAIATLVELLSTKLPQLTLDPETLLSVVKIAGGVADNIIPAQASALLSFRIAPKDTFDYATKLRSLFGPKATVTEVLSVPAVASSIPKTLSFLGKGQRVKYCTELNFFKRGMVLGPGDITYAHTDAEKISKRELAQAVELYKKILLEYSR